MTSYLYGFFQGYMQKSAADDVGSAVKKGGTVGGGLGASGMLKPVSNIKPASGPLKTPPAKPQQPPPPAPESPAIKQAPDDYSFMQAPTNPRGQPQQIAQNDLPIGVPRDPKLAIGINKANSDQLYLMGFLQGYLKKSAGAMSRDAGYIDTNARLQENAGNQVARAEAVNPQGLVSPQTAANGSDIQKLKLQGAPSHDAEGNAIDPEWAEQYAWASKTIPHSKEEEFKIDQIKQMATLKSRIARGRQEYDAGLQARQDKVDAYNQGMAEREGAMPRAINNEVTPEIAAARTSKPLAGQTPVPSTPATQNAGTGKPVSLGQHLQRDAAAQKAHDAEQLAKMNARHPVQGEPRKYVASGDTATINGKPVAQNDVIDHEGLKRVADSRQKADQEFAAATRGLDTSNMGGQRVAAAPQPAPHKFVTDAVKPGDRSLLNGVSAGAKKI